MATFIITESQTVLAVREVEADSRDEALELFWEGQGREVGKDGDVVSSVLLSVEEIEETEA